MTTDTSGLAAGNSSSPAVTVHIEPVLSKIMASFEFNRLMDGSDGFSGKLPMVAENGLCIALTGTGPNGEKNAHRIAEALNLLEQPGTGPAVRGLLNVIAENNGAERQQKMPVAELLGHQVEALQAEKDAAYLERNQLVAALAKLFPSGVARTAIEGWAEEWHGCVYIDLPAGQASWHFHDSQAYLFEGLPTYSKAWDGHDTPEKYARLAALPLHRRPPAGGQCAKGKLRVSSGWLVTEDGHIPVAEVSMHSTTADGEADMIRLAAAWNACEGIPLELIQQHPGIVGATLPYHQLQAQRDMLLTTLKGVLASADAHIDGPGYVVLDRARAVVAIAKASAQQEGGAA